MMRKDRDLSFDVFRGLAIIAVVAIHTFDTVFPWKSTAKMNREPNKYDSGRKYSFCERNALKVGVAPRYQLALPIQVLVLKSDPGPKSSGFFQILLDTQFRFLYTNELNSEGECELD